MRALPPPAAELDLGEGFPAAARQAIEDGERALHDLRDNSVARWCSVGAALKALQNVALNRSGANNTGSPKYRRAYALLSYAWPELAKIDKTVRSHAIWLFEAWDDQIEPWYKALPRSQRDQWTHPTVIRRHYDKRHPNPLSAKSTAYKPRRPRQMRRLNRQALGERSREDLEAIIAEQDAMIADRDREIIELNDQLEEQRRTIEQLRNDLAWEQTTRRQLEAVTTPGPVTVVRPGGASVEVMHAVSRESQEIAPPLRFGHPDYTAWAKLVAVRIGELSALELHYLIEDNAAHLDALETAAPGAGIGLEDRIKARMAELEISPSETLNAGASD